MKRVFTSVFLLSLAGSSALLAQSTEPITVAGKPQAPASEVKQLPRAGKISVAPTSKYYIQPKDYASYVAQGGLQKGKSVKRASQPKKTEKIAASEVYPDSIYFYSVLDSRTDDANGFAQGQVLGYYLNGNTKLYQEHNGLVLPTETVGSNGSYVLVDGKWYCFCSEKISVYDAKTGQLVQTKTDYLKGDTPVRRPTGAAYDASSDNFYVPTWSGILEVKRSDLSSEIVGNFEAFPLTMVSAKDGIYYIAYDGSLYKFNKETGAGTQLYANVKGDIEWINNVASASFDFATGKLYFNYLDYNWQGNLAVFDPATRKTTHLIAYPQDCFAMAGFSLPWAADKAPAAVSGISFADNKVTFTAPTKTYDGAESLSGTLKALVTIDDNNTVEATVAAGAQTTIDLNLADGAHKLTIQVANDKGSSPERVDHVFVGSDIPNAVGNLTLSITADMQANLSWDAPTSSLNYGPVDEAALNYDVIRYPGAVQVATGIKATTFSEQLTDARHDYYYEVVSHAGTTGNAKAKSNVFPAGSVWYPPYKETFYYEENFQSFKIIDRNADGNTWTRMCPNNDPTLAEAWLHGNGVTDPETGAVATYNDDYFITPKVSLKAGKDYRLSFDWGDNFYYGEKMNIFLGKGDEIADSVALVASNFSMDYVPGSTAFIFHVAEDGNYNIFFHSTTVGNSVNVILDNIAVELYANYDAPDSVVNVSAVAGAQGALVNTLSFTAPSKTYAQGQLSNITRIEVFRNESEQPVHVFESPAVGANLSWTDTDVENGLVTYKLVPYNEAGQGLVAEVTNWVGLDVPADVPTLAIKQVQGEWGNYTAQVDFTQVSDKGKHGGYVVPEEVKYVLYRYDEYNFSEHWQAQNNPTSAFTITDENYWGWGQAYVTYLLVAQNAAGQSDGYMAGIVLGEPYALPYNESFAYGFVNKDPWTRMTDNYNYAWNISTGSGISVKPYDNDGGMLSFTYINETSNKEVMTTPRVSLDNTVNPELSFYMYHGTDAEEDDVVLDLYTNYQDEGWVAHKAILDYNNGTEGWSRFSLPLDNTKKDVQLAFAATAIGAVAPIYIDNIMIAEGNKNDLALENLKVEKKRVEAGEPGVFSVAVANYGMETANGYSVTLLKDGEPVATQTGDNTVTNEVKTYRFSVPTTKAEAGESHQFSAAIALDGDVNTANDSSAVVKLSIRGNLLPAVDALQGTSAAGSVNLSWTAPEKDSYVESATDDFDSYDNFIITNIGDWITYDGDGSTYTIGFTCPEYDNYFAPMAWQVWNPTRVGFDLNQFPVLKPHSGDRYLATWAATTESSVIPSDDWLISPAIVGGSDISFWYRVPNAGSDAQVFEIMTTDLDSTDPLDFTTLDRDSLEGTTDWVKFEFTLPKTAKHFAIRACSQTGNYIVAFLDDLTYTSISNPDVKVALTGYKVYRDGQLIATLGKDQTTYSDADANVAAGNSYFVTAVYAEGESNGSNVYVSDFSAAIHSANANAVKAHQKYNISGQRVNDSYKGIVIENGKKHIRR